MIKIRLTKLKPTAGNSIEVFALDKPKSGYRFVYYEEDKESYTDDNHISQDHLFRPR